MNKILSTNELDETRNALKMSGISILCELLNLEYGAYLAIAGDSKYYQVVIDDGEDDTFIKAKMDAMADPTCSDTGLQADVTVGTLLDTNDTFSAHATEVKTVLVTVGMDDTTKALEIISYEKTTGEYGSIPGGKTHGYNLKEYTIAALASTMTEVQSWL